MKNKNLLKIAFVALFAAIICIGCFIKIPLGPIPIVLQNVLCILTALLLGGILGAAPTALFLLAGLIGLPVYSGGSGGIAVWAGPTGGFLSGYFVGAIVAGFIAGKPSVKEKKFSAKVLIRLIIAMLLGMIILYVPGVIHFSHWAEITGKIPENKTSFSYTMAACVIPYIPGDILKIVVSVPIALKVRPILAQYLFSDSKNSGDSENARDSKTQSEKTTESNEDEAETTNSESEK